MVDDCARVDDRARVDDPSTRAGKEAAVAADALVYKKKDRNLMRRNFLDAAGDEKQLIDFLWP